jgi:hypothetical protein
MRSFHTRADGVVVQEISPVTTTPALRATPPVQEGQFVASENPLFIHIFDDLACEYDGAV